MERRTHVEQDTNSLMLGAVWSTFRFIRKANIPKFSDSCVTNLPVWVKVFILICCPNLNEKYTEILGQEVRGVAADALIKDNSRSFGGGTSAQF